MKKNGHYWQVAGGADGDALWTYATFEQAKLEAVMALCEQCPGQVEITRTETDDGATVFRANDSGPSLTLRPSRS